MGRPLGLTARAPAVLSPRRQPVYGSSEAGRGAAPRARHSPSVSFAMARCLAMAATATIRTRGGDPLLTALFPKWTNKLPAIVALGAAATGLFVVFVVWYWFSPKHTDVGYQPYQPISYSHQLHAGQKGIDCRYCHRMVEDGPQATIPDAATCFGCHAQVKKDSPQLQVLRDAYGTGQGDGTPIKWVKVHLLPQYAYFDHSVHLRA